MKEIPDPQVRAVFTNYPTAAQAKMLTLRKWMFETPGPDRHPVEESLKWGEPSYRCKSGSPVRLGVREEPELTLCLFFHCQTLLVETFKELYRDELTFDGNRAILLQANQKLPAVIIKDCIAMAHEYHLRKHLPLLGAG